MTSAFDNKLSTLPYARPARYRSTYNAKQEDGFARAGHSLHAEDRVRESLDGLNRQMFTGRRPSSAVPSPSIPRTPLAWAIDVGEEDVLGVHQDPVSRASWRGHSDPLCLGSWQLRPPLLSCVCSPAPGCELCCKLMGASACDMIL
jgi:hypothetical protein